MNITSNANTKLSSVISVNELRQRMIDELTLAGMAPRSQQTYLNAVDRLAARSWQSIEDMTEKDVQTYLLGLRNNGAARGTFKTAWFGVQFLFHHVLGRNWDLFTKKRSDNLPRNVCPAYSHIMKFNGY